MTTINDQDFIRWYTTLPGFHNVKHDEKLLDEYKKKVIHTYVSNKAISLEYFKDKALTIVDKLTKNWSPEDVIEIADAIKHYTLEYLEFRDKIK